MTMSTNCKYVSRIPIAIPTNQIAMHAPTFFAQWTGVSLVSVPSLVTFLDIPKMFSTHRTSPLGRYYCDMEAYVEKAHRSLGPTKGVKIYNLPPQITEILLFKMQFHLPVAMGNIKITKSSVPIF